MWGKKKKKEKIQILDRTNDFMLSAFALLIIHWYGAFESTMSLPVCILQVMQLWGPGYKGGVAQLLCWKYCGNPRGSSGVLVETALKTKQKEDEAN